MGITFLPGIEVCQWIAPTFLNGWTIYGGGWAPPGYLIDSTGFVWMRGLITGGTSNLFTLPAAYRPDTTTTSASGGFPIITAAGLARLNVSTSTGAVSLSIVPGAWASLSGVRYKSA